MSPSPKTTPVFEPFVAREVFSELNGFVLCDPSALDRHHGGTARGLDLLTMYSTSEQGDAVAAAGIAIPVIGLEADWYTLAVRHVETATLLVEPPLLVSTGWVLCVEAERLCLSGAGYLTRWDPENEKVLRPSVPSGWYEVEIHCGFGKSDRSETVVEFVLNPVSERPTFAADLGTEFDFTSEALER